MGLCVLQGLFQKNATVEELRREMEQFLKLRLGALDRWEPPSQLYEVEQGFINVLTLIKPQQDIYSLLYTSSYFIAHLNIFKETRHF